MKKIHAGWRFFKCPECGLKWKETCRDYETESSSLCPDKECEMNLRGGVSPYGGEPDPSLPTDEYGNLLEYKEMKFE